MAPMLLIDPTKGIPSEGNFLVANERTIPGGKNRAACYLKCKVFVNTYLNNGIYLMNITIYDLTLEQN